jgi:hypothetical protein
MMDRSTYFRFAYAMPCHKDRELRPHQLRDTDSGLFLSEALVKSGYRYGGPIINYPSSGPDLRPFDDRFLGETDLILLTTRPPMTDLEVGDRKSIRRSFTTLEDKVFKALQTRFKSCARSEIVLQDATARISDEIAKRQSVVFRQNGGAAYQHHGSPYTGEWRRFKRAQPLTAVFLVFIPHAWRGGPALLAAFGMGGTETLVWCYQLATRFSHLLFTKSFVMGEMRTGRLHEPSTLKDFADSWETTILGAERLSAIEEPSAHPSL